MKFEFSPKVRHKLNTALCCAKCKVPSAIILASLPDFSGSAFSPINNITAANDCFYFRSLIPRCAHPAGIFSGGSIQPHSANLWEYSRRCVRTRRLFPSAHRVQRIKANLYGSLLTDDEIKPIFVLLRNVCSFKDSRNFAKFKLTN